MQPVALEELTRAADLICKATVIADRRVTDDSFEPIGGFEVHEAELRVVSIVKGAAPNVIRFRHFAPSMPELSREQLDQLVKAMPEVSREELVNALRELSVVLSREQLERFVKVMPKLSHEEPEKLEQLFKEIGKAPDTYHTPTIATGRTYLVVAAQTAGGAYRQLGKLPLFQGPMAHGVLLAADARPHHGTTLSEAAWAELFALLKSPVEDDAVGAIRQLDSMSGGPAWNQSGGPGDFERSQALAAIQPLLGATH